MNVTQKLIVKSLKRKFMRAFIFPLPQPAGQAAPCWTLQPSAIASLLAPGPSLVCKLIEYMFNIMQRHNNGSIMKNRSIQ